AGACATAARDALVRGGSATEMGPALYALFQDAGLPSPRVKLDLQVAASPALARWSCDVLTSLLRSRGETGPPELGDLDTLPDRLHEEVLAANAMIHSIALYGVWAQKLE